MTFAKHCLNWILTLGLSIPLLAFGDDEPSSTNINPSNTHVIYASSGEYWHPFLFPKRNQVCERTGIYMDALIEVFVNQFQLRLSCQFVPWKRAQQAVELGEADVLITVPTPQRLEYAVASTKPIAQLYMHVYTYQNHPRLKQIQEISSVEDILSLNLHVATNFGNGWHKANIEKFGVKTHHLESNERLLRFLANKRADIIIDAPNPIESRIEKLGLSDRLLKTEARFGPLNFHLLLGKKSKHFPRFKDIDTAITELKLHGELDSFAEKYQ